MKNVVASKYAAWYNFTILYVRQSLNKSWRKRVESVRQMEAVAYEKTVVESAGAYAVLIHDDHLYACQRTGFICFE